MEPFPIVLVGVDYWQGLVDWMAQRMLAQDCISPEELNLFQLVDTSDEAVQIILSQIHAESTKLVVPD